MIARQPRSRFHQRGASLLFAVFVLTATALVLALMVSTLTGRSLSTARVIQTEQAHYAARAGLEVAMQQVLPPGAGCNQVSSSLTVEGFAVNVTCTPVAVAEGGQNYTIYDITATATAGDQSAGTFVSRRVSATFQDSN